uniref:AIG1-type G domain-containing protein n=1 Tax=Electrophorus electricus TaxID=8005 RepID=A0A4W4DM84_ELEEL
MTLDHTCPPPYLIEKGNPTVRVLHLQSRYSKNEGVKHCVFGQKVEAAKNKVILLLGATGSGKTTLINAMINYILGVKWGGNYHFKLINEVTNRSQAESQTTEVTSYELYNEPGFQAPYSLTIVDTPGFGDTRGIEHDKQITEQIKNFLCNPLGIQHIDAVCFVIRASLIRLSPTQKYIFDSVLSIFGKDIAENIMIMVTFAHGTDIPALEAISAAEVPCQKNKKGLHTHFSFNNSALYAQNNEMTWASNFKKIKTFFRALEDNESRDLKMTIQVLEEHERLARAMEALAPQIKAGLSKCAEIESKKQMLKNENEKIKENENFEQELEKVRPVRTAVNCFTMNCSRCFFTCHSSCFLPEEDSISTCAVFDNDGKCVLCPGNCYYSNHVNKNVMGTYETIKKTQTIKELRDNFNKAKTAFMSTHDMLEKLDKEYKHIYSKLKDLVKLSFSCLMRLDKIALKPRSLSAKEYFELLINTKEDETKSGFEELIVKLQKMKEEFENLEKIPIKSYQEHELVEL